jgi:hypothetical protein
MKRLSLLILPFAALLVLAGCKKDENRVIFEGGTAPVLTASRTTNIPLSFDNRATEAVTLRWTNPAYKFNTGISSQNVTYRIEIDTTGANFTNPNRRTISVSNELSRSFTQEELNDILLSGLELRPNMAHDIEFRVTSFMGTNAVPLSSNVLKFRTTPYPIPPKVEPYSNEVYIVGNATPGGWNNPVPTPAQKMTQISPTMFELTLPMTAGGSYLFLPVNGSWSQKYGFDGGNNTNPPLAGDFKREGGDFLAPTESGIYKIELNFQTGKYKLTKQ